MKGRKLASPKQIKFARVIAEALDINMSFNEGDSYYDVSEFIREYEDEYKKCNWKKQVFAKLITLMQSHVLVMDTKSLMKIVAMVMFLILYQGTKMRMHVYCGENPL